MTLPVQNTPISLSQQRYADTFQLFCNLSHEYKYMIDAMSNMLLDYSSTPFTLLDIGPAKGQFTRSVLERTQLQPNVYAAYEPNENYFQHLSSHIDHVTGQTQLHCAPFTPNTTLHPEWDVILMSHCMYWLQPAQPHIKSVLKGLSDSGTLVIFLQPAGGLYLIQNLFKSLLPAHGSTLNQHYSSYELMHDLKQICLKGTETLLPGFLDLTKIWNDEAKLTDLACFFLGSELSLQPPDVRKAVIYYIRSSTLQLNDRKLFNQPTSLITIKAEDRC